MSDSNYELKKMKLPDNYIADPSVNQILDMLSRKKGDSAAKE